MEPDGTYRFDNVPAGNVTLALQLRQPVVARAEVVAVLPGGAARWDFSIALDRHQVSGRVVDLDGIAVAGALATLASAAGETLARTHSGGDGRFAFAVAADAAGLSATAAMGDRAARCGLVEPGSDSLELVLVPARR